MGLFKKDKVDESLIVESPQNELIPSPQSLPDNLKEQMKAEIIDSVRLNLNAEKHESHEYREEIIPPVITVGTDLDREDPLSGDLHTKTDKWGFWLEYQGTKGKVFNTEVPQFQFGHIGAILPALRSHVYKYTYDIDEKTGNVKRNGDGSPIILKKERVHLGIELSNLKSRLNLAEDGYARNQQKDVIIGGVGQVDPYTGDRMKEALDFAFGKKR